MAHSLPCCGHSRWHQEVSTLSRGRHTERAASGADCSCSSIRIPSRLLGKLTLALLWVLGAVAYPKIANNQLCYHGIIGHLLNEAGAPMEGKGGRRREGKESGDEDETKYSLLSLVLPLLPGPFRSLSATGPLSRCCTMRPSLRQQVQTHGKAKANRKEGAPRLRASARSAFASRD